LLDLEGKCARITAGQNTRHDPSAIGGDVSL